MDVLSAPCRRIAVVGSGISGLSAAWLLSQRHDVTLFEQAGRLGGHANTVSIEAGGRKVRVDTGFIVFNRATYPNLLALFEHIGVDTHETEMSFAVSRHDGRLEYAGTDLGSLFAQRLNALRPPFWSMLRDLRRFYATAPRDLEQLAAAPETLGTYLARRNYGERFRDDHILPMAAAIWSAPARTMLDYPAASFIRFFDNHGLLKLRARPPWHTVLGGSQEYVRKLTQCMTSIRRNAKIIDIRRDALGVAVRSQGGAPERFDHVVIAAHADEALALLSDASEHERRLLGAFRYTRNRAVLHSDVAFMPRRRRIWSSWNYIETEGAYVTYWMNRLQRIPASIPLFVSINPSSLPRAEAVLHTEEYAHPVFDDRAVRAQQDLWSLQGKQNTWFCGAYFGAGFHEDGLQAGLAVAEDLGGLRRPWRVQGDSSRIVRGSVKRPVDLRAAS